MTRRIERISEVLRRELASFIIREMVMKEALVTFTRVEVSSDLHYADAYFVCLPDTSEGKFLQVLNRNIFSIQQSLNKRLRMRPVPKVRFHIDREEEEAAKIENILNDLHERV